MQKSMDSKIQARVRILLARRWVDLRSVTIGTTNGVVYLGGTLRTTGGGGGSRPADAGWVDKIRREIATIPEVRDVVLQGFEPTGEACPEKSA